jgi:hypothetical protein
MSDFNTKLYPIQEYLKSISGKALLISNESNLLNLLSYDNLKILSNPNQTISDYVDNLLLTNIFHKELLKYNQKFDTIIIHNLLEQIKHPTLFLQNLNLILNDGGSIVCTLSNFYYIHNILNFLIGDIIQDSSKNLSNFYNLEKFLFFLNKNNMHIIKVSRITNEFSLDKINIDKKMTPHQLIDMIKKIPDHDVSQYVLMIGKNKIIPSENLEFVSQFPKNYLLPQLQNFFDKFVELEKSVLNKDTLISGLENSIKEQKDYTESSLSKKDTLISGLENSIKEQKELIQGHENSIKEQKDYTKGLQKQIDSLESYQKKLKFWKR